MKITRFEDFEAWKASRDLSRDVHAVTSSRGFRFEAGLRNQMRRAASSAMANIAEGFNSGTDAEFARFLRISRKSATEVQSHLYSALDARHLSQEDFDRLYGRAEDVKRLIGGFVRYLTNSKKKEQTDSRLTQD